MTTLPSALLVATNKTFGDSPSPSPTAFDSPVVEGSAPGALFSEDVDRALEDVLPQQDVFDDPHFNPIEYINTQFPDEHSLMNLESFMGRLKSKIKEVDEEILTTVRKQSGAGLRAKQDLAEAKKSIHGLFTKINDIKHKAEESEAMVQELCKDIRSLDYGKRHLTVAIKTLQRLHLLVAAIDQLKNTSNKRQYKTAAKLLMAVNGLLSHFEPYREIQKIAELRETFAAIKKALQKQIFDEFRKLANESYSEPDANAKPINYATYADACLVINALGEDVRKDLVKTFVGQQIDHYKTLFASNLEVSNLENLHRRFHWVKKQLKNFEERYGNIFPKFWAVPQEICVDFCLTTRADVSRNLDQNRDALDVGILLRGLAKTLEFEKEMQKRFGTDMELLTSLLAEDNEDSASSPDAAAATTTTSKEEISATYDALKQKYQKASKQSQVQEEVAQKQRRLKEIQESRENDLAPTDYVPSNYRFIGLISNAFEEYMEVYVKFEDRNMGQTLQKMVREEIWEPTDERSDIIETSRSLFIYIKESLKKCSALSRGRTLYHLSEVWKKYLKTFSQNMMEKIPKPQSSDPKATDPTASLTLKLSERDENMLVYIVNSAEYCISNISGLEEKLREVIDEEYKKKIDFTSVVEEFSGLITHAVKVLIIGIQTRFDSALTLMTKINWATLEAVGDHSEYVTMICQQMSDTLPSIANKISKTYFKFFCDKFAASFWALFINNIYKCKRISEIGGRQLLLDAQEFKKYFLKAIPSINESKFPPNAVSSYTKLVTMEASKAERILKLIYIPNDSLVELYKSLYATTSAIPGKTSGLSLNPQSISDLQKIMDLKGMKKSEQAAVIEELTKEAQKGRPHVGSALGSTSADVTKPSGGNDDSKFIKLLNNTFGIN